MIMLSRKTRVRMHDRATTTMRGQRARHGLCIRIPRRRGSVADTAIRGRANSFTLARVYQCTRVHRSRSPDVRIYWGCRYALHYLSHVHIKYLNPAKDPFQTATPISPVRFGRSERGLVHRAQRPLACRTKQNPARGRANCKDHTHIPPWGWSVYYISYHLETR
jgi:hypothetical protein